MWSAPDGAGDKPTEAEIEAYADAVVAELQSWGYIEEADVVDPDWIEVAYTWSYPDSQWKKKRCNGWRARYLSDRALRPLDFSGIADSVRDGFTPVPASSN